MKIELHIDPATTPEHAEVYVQALTPPLQTALDQLGQVDQQWWGYQEKQIIPLDLRRLSLIRASDDTVTAYRVGGGPVQLRERLYQLEAALPSNFIRVFKGEIVNGDLIDHLTVGLNGLINIAMQDGQVAMVSRRYMKLLKERLGL
ncbi:LytTR family DNA-binding domain-containing protein [Lacticaseibacillus mingshuiensis]|uniref:LytTR family DNA-binding domain-containing protein n=1 Tax=Lacticaseibacillus mingshuiensis TaxID=2799574 RepID=UPI00195187A0|nr:LytTR family DNA-binding domain-containing protein [Lacticaseibacillus mingshuiensis]